MHFYTYFSVKFQNHHISSVIDRHKRESQEDTKKIVDELREREIIVRL